MYLAHSTRTRSCCFMDSQTSVMQAIFFPRMSVFSMVTDEVIYKRKSNVFHTTTRNSLFSRVHQYNQPVCWWKYICLKRYTIWPNYQQMCNMKILVRKRFLRLIELMEPLAVFNKRPCLIVARLFNAKRFLNHQDKYR